MDAQRILIVGTLLTFVMLAPIAQNCRLEPQDDFPLSYYPMFTKVRGQRTTLYHAVGQTESGDTIDLPGRFLGAGGMNQVRKRARRLVKNGDAEGLCTQVARRVARSRTEAHRAVLTVKVVRSRYPVQPSTVQAPVPSERKVYAECPVSRRP